MKIEEEKILCVFNNNLILVPFEDCASGMYPIYEKAEIIKTNVKDTEEYGLLITDDVEFALIEDSWDGFSESYLTGIDALREIKRFLNEYIE